MVIQHLGLQLVRDDAGSTATEYALIAALMAIAAIAGLLAFADSVIHAWTVVADTVGAAVGS